MAVNEFGDDVVIVPGVGAIMDALQEIARQLSDLNAVLADRFKRD